MQHTHGDDGFQDRPAKKRKIDKPYTRNERHEEADVTEVRSGPIQSYGDSNISGSASLWQGNLYGTQVNHYHLPHQPPEDVTLGLLFKSLQYDHMDARARNIADATIGTCQWLQKHKNFGHWAFQSLEADDQAILWIKGKPGSGKSVIMKSLVEWAKKEWSTHIILTYFFNARSPDVLHKSSLGLYRSLVHQLLSTSKAYRALLLEEFATKERRGHSIEDWNVIELQNFLSRVIAAHSGCPITIFVDALDEGGNDDVRDMVRYLDVLVHRSLRTGVQVRICLASRHYPQITLRKCLSVIVDKQIEHERDIELYISRHLVDDGNFQSSKLRDQVRLRSGGVFLWIVLVVASLNKLFDKGVGLRQRLQHLQTIPPNLHALFAEIFSNDCQNIEECYTLLHWVLFTLEPLRVNELYVMVLNSSRTTLWDEDLAPEDAMKRYLVDCSRGLVEFSNGPFATVQFIHETVRDFLLQRIERQTDGLVLTVLPEFQSDSCHMRMAEECLQLLVDRPKLPTGLIGFAAQSWWKYVFASNLPWTAHLFGLACSLLADERNLLAYDSDYSPHLPRVHTADDLAHPLYQAARRGLANVVTQMLQQGIDVDAGINEHPVALMVASQPDCTDAIQELIEDDQHDYFESHRFTALQVATYLGDTQMVQLLLAHGANANACGTWGTALQRASWAGHTEIVCLLLSGGAVKEAGPRADHRTGRILASAAIASDGAQLQADQGADVDAQGEGRWASTSLMLASQGGHREIVQVLLDAGADVNARKGQKDAVAEPETSAGTSNKMYQLLFGGGNSATSLIEASSRGHTQIVLLLLSAGANVNAQGRWGNVTSLMEASTFGHIDIVRILVENGAEVNTRDMFGKTALDLATDRNKPEVVQILLEHGGTSTSTRYPGRTALLTSLNL